MSVNQETQPGDTLSRILQLERIEVGKPPAMVCRLCLSENEKRMEIYDSQGNLVEHFILPEQEELARQWMNGAWWAFCWAENSLTEKEKQMTGLNAAERQELQERRIRCQELEQQVTELVHDNTKLSEQAQDEIFVEALEHLDRGDQEGTFYQQVAFMWSGLLQITVLPRTVPLLMAAVKLCSEARRHDKDTIVEMIGHVRFAHEIGEMRRCQRGWLSSRAS